MYSQTFYTQKILFGAIIACGLSLLCGKAYSTPVPGTKEYPLKLQPELDSLDVSKYLQNERLIRLQFKCLIFDGPCDIVGRWAKPRAKAAILGQCLMCTKTQEKWLEDWFEILVEKFPDMYRAAFAKYVQNEGIEISEEDKQKIEKVFSEEQASQFVSDIRKDIPLVEGKSKLNDIDNGSSTKSSTTPTSSTT